MELFLFNSHILDTNNYLLYDEVSKESVLIDCSSNIDKISEKINILDAKLKYILLTHAHFDHILTLNNAKKTFADTKILISKNDNYLYENVKLQTEYFGIDFFNVPKINEYIDEKSNISIGKNQVKIIETPGHTKGSLSFLIENRLFSGDTLFFEQVGRCDLPGGDFSKIENSIKNKLFNLPDNTTIFPGHGVSTSIQYEKENNFYFGSSLRN